MIANSSNLPLLYKYKHREPKSNQNANLAICILTCTEIQISIQSKSVKSPIMSHRCWPSLLGSTPMVSKVPLSDLQANDIGWRAKNRLTDIFAGIARRPKHIIGKWQSYPLNCQQIQMEIQQSNMFFTKSWNIRFNITSPTILWMWHFRCFSPRSQTPGLREARRSDQGTSVPIRVSAAHLVARKSQRQSNIFFPSQRTTLKLSIQQWWSSQQCYIRKRRSYYLVFRVLILHDRHLPSIAGAHNNSHRGSLTDPLIYTAEQSLRAL